MSRSTLPPKPTGLARIWRLPSGQRRVYWHDHVLTIYTPRIWRWAFAVWLRFGTEFLLGVLIYRNEDRELYIEFGLGPVELVLNPTRMFTRREVRRRERERRDEIGREAEAFLREQHQ